MEQDIHDFHIYASNLLKTAETRVLKEGNMFGVFNVAGDIETYGSGVKGLYLDDTRHLNHLDVRLYDKRPILLSSTVKRDNLLLTADLTNPDFEYGGLKIPDDMLHLLRSKFLYGKGCYERLEIQNFAWKGSYPIELTLRFDADFRDMFAIRGAERRGQGQRHEPYVDGDTILFRYTGLDERVRATRVGFSATPDQLEPGKATFHLDLLSGDSSTLEYTVECDSWPAVESRDEQAAVPLEFDDSYGHLKKRRHDVADGHCYIESSNEMLDAWLTRSRADLFMLQVETDWGPYPHAGIPWFNTKFGRDGIWTAYEVLSISPGVARGVLGYLADKQATEIDPSRDAEPGKILHETREGEAAAVGDVPFQRYYGSVDSTPLFVWLAGAYLRRTDDQKFLEQLWPSIEAAIHWLDEYGDHDDDGFVEYSRQTPTGLAQQGWKDSHDSIFHQNGDSAPGPIALCEVQAYVYGARRAAASIARTLDKPEFAEEQRQKAEQLRERFEKVFWSEDIQMYALALDGNNDPCEVRSSNPGHCLIFDFVSAERAEILVDHLTSEDFFSQWGIRTLAQGESRYNPLSYHNGSIWPHDNALIARGMANYGFHEETAQLFDSLFEASQFFDLHRLPELFCGVTRRTGEGPTQYPVACSPQAWAAGAVYLLLSSMLDLQVDARRSSIEFYQPMLPEGVEGLSIHDLPVGACSVDLAMRRYDNDVGIEVLDRRGPVNVRVMK
jgi:glycogen debranching enzyme